MKTIATFDHGQNQWCVQKVEIGPSPVLFWCPSKARAEQLASELNKGEQSHMKDKQILIQLEQIAAIIRDEINRETDMDRNCRLQDAQEYLRRAWHAADGSATEDNDTTIETQRAMTL